MQEDRHCCSLAKSKQINPLKLHDPALGMGREMVFHREREFCFQ